MQTAGLIAMGIAIAAASLSLGIRYSPDIGAAIIKWIRQRERHRELATAIRTGRILTNAHKETP